MPRSSLQQQLQCAADDRSMPVSPSEPRIGISLVLIACLAAGGCGDGGDIQAPEGADLRDRTFDQALSAFSRPIRAGGSTATA
jgi:hypothetical protein